MPHRATKAGPGSQLGVLRSEDLGSRTGDVPDPCFVDNALKATGGRAERAGLDHGAQRGMLDGVGARVQAGGGARLEIAVEVDGPGGPIEGGGGVMPHVVADGGRAADRNVLTGRGGVVDGFEVGRDHVARGIDAEDVVGVDVRALGLGGAVGQERHEVRDPARAGRARDPGPGPLEPRFDRELGKVELARITERHIRATRAEIEAVTGGSQRADLGCRGLPGLLRKSGRRRRRWDCALER